MGDSYDYVVCGGGTAGPVIAARLAENDANASVILIEAGQDSAELETMHMAGAWTMNHKGETDWNIHTPAQEGLNNREVHVPRGRFLGGSSGCNGTICVRGTRQDYDDWNVPEFSGEEMFRAMRKSECYHPQKWFPEDKKEHGYDGPLGIEPAPCGPLGDLFLKNYQSKGLPYIPDLFTSGEAANGCGHAMRTTWKGNRTTGADFVTKDRKLPNIKIQVHTIVDKVILEKGGDGKFVAKGVECVDEKGGKLTFHAKKEVILCCGTYCDPAILNRSGIGEAKELEALNIPVLIDNKYVGKNLQDHQLIFIYYELNKDGLTDDARVNHDPDAVANGMEQWRKDKTGWLSTFPFGSFAFARLNDRLDAENKEWQAFPREPGRDPMGLTEKQPNLEFFHTVCYGGPPEYTDKPKEGQFAFAMCCFLMNIQSRGFVKLKSTEPLDNPIVDHRYLSDKRDLLMMSEGVRFANELVTTGEGTKDLIKGAWPPGATHHLNKTNEDWQPFVQKYASTSYHPGGTCKLGPEDDKEAVVGPTLIVKGTSNLRVADCSIMPTIHSGHTQMPAFGIGELAAEFIIKANK